MIVFVLLEIEYILWGHILIHEIVQQGLCGTIQCMKPFVSDCAKQTVFMKPKRQGMLILMPFLRYGVAGIRLRIEQGNKLPFDIINPCDRVPLGPSKTINCLLTISVHVAAFH